MSLVGQTHDDWQALGERLGRLGMEWQPSKLFPVHVSIERASLDRQAALEHLEARVDQKGWLQQPSCLMLLPADRKAACRQPPLLAEGCKENSSWRLRHLHVDRWEWTEVQHLQVEPEEATHLAESISHLATETVVGKLEYLRLWRFSSAVGKPELELAVLVGFTGGNP